MIKFPVYSSFIAVLALLLSPAAGAQERIDLSGSSARIIGDLPPLEFSKPVTAERERPNTKGLHTKPPEPEENDPVLQAFSRALGLKPDKGESIAFLFEEKVPLTGMTTWHMQQRYQGVPVWGERITVTARKGEKPQRISGHTLHSLSEKKFSMIAHITAQQALQQARKLAGVTRTQAHRLSTESGNSGLQGLASQALAQNDISKQVIYFDEKTGKSHLAWEVSFFAIVNGKPVKPVYMIDARSGSVLLQYNNIQNLHGGGPGGNAKTGCYTYGKDNAPVLQITKNKEGMCFLKSRDVTTWDCKHQKDYNKCKIHSFSCNTNSVKKINGACAPLNDAHFFNQLVFDMYRDWYKMRPLKKPLNVLVHYGKNLDNAFWNGSFVHFGDGGKTFYPTVGLDISSHEISHGFTQQHSGLIYKGQSGGLNESFSDMAGEAAEAYFKEKYGKAGRPGRKQPDDTAMMLSLAPRSSLSSPSSGRADRQATSSGSVSDINSMISGQGGVPSGRVSSYAGAGYTASEYESPDAVPEAGINALLGGISGSGEEAQPKERQAKERQAAAGGTGKTLLDRSLPDWTVGKDIVLKQDGALRYMYNPPKDGKSIDSAIKYYDGMDVHHSSGIFNKAFYLLANKEGWSVRKAFAVFLVASHSWTPRENFLSAALKTLQAAKDLKYEVGDVKAVFRAVHVFVNP